MPSIRPFLLQYTIGEGYNSGKILGWSFGVVIVYVLLQSSSRIPVTPSVSPEKRYTITLYFFVLAYLSIWVEHDRTQKDRMSNFAALREGIENAISILGTGLLNTGNTTLRASLKKNKEFYRQLVRFHFRLIFSILRKRPTALPSCIRGKKERYAKIIPWEDFIHSQAVISLKRMYGQNWCDHGKNPSWLAHSNYLH